MKNIAGMKFGKLIALNPVNKNKQGKYIWRCICDCGNFKEVCVSQLVNGDTKSCGCLQSENGVKNIKLAIECIKKHSMHGTKFYRTWWSMKCRCTKVTHPRYKDWGGRGITCNDYLDFIPFMKDHYENYLKACKELGEENVTIDREDNNGNYVKDNIRWVTMKVQAKNKRPRSKKVV
jgi:hypothetical protein